ncbi:TIGR00730 family Rossman fold protein [Planctomicrobium sp. SH661]|uniref:LOG family protein n=1 Tax=Planctomicrobium sp. SH661 TaxID=3448124 RepID=UPI003F5B6A00
MQSICVFCGSKPGHDPTYGTAATTLGHALADRGIRLVYGGGNVGIMGIVADAVLERGGEVTGVIPESLMNRELAHAGVADMRIVGSMHIRKALMADLSQGFVALPGGLGTFEELCEILTWSQLGFHHKPVALLNVKGYYDPLLMMLDRSVSEGFLSTANRNKLFVANTVPELMAFFDRESPNADTSAPLPTSLT